MKNSIYILIITILTLASCSPVDLEPVGVGKGNYVEFIPRPANFRGYDVTEVPTKAVYTDEQLTTLESKVHTAYFMIFKPNGQRHTFEALTVTDYNSIASYKIRTDVNNSDVTACFLANVPYSYALSLDTKAKLLNTPLPLDYATYAETGYIGIPKLKLDLNGDKIDDATSTPCIPMCGIYEGPLDASAQQTILLNRLFAKVTVNLSMNMGTNLLEGVLGGALDDFFGDLFGDITIGNTAENARFEMSRYTLNNIPNQVLMVPAKKEVENSTPIITESPWVENTAKFEDPEEFEVETTIYDKSHPRADQPGYPTTFGFTFYTPEYALLPEASAVSAHTGKENRERFKPLLYDQDKKPIHMTLEGRLHDHGGSYANVKYKIYFGENNFDSFSLFRNNLYNNNLEIKNTGHLETGSTIDNRVEILPLNLVEAYGQAANCYIISIPGTYEIDAYKGVVKPTDLASSTKFTGKPYTVWNTTENTNVITYPEEEISQDKIVFTVSNSSGAIAPGNAVIAIRDANNNILWSWHLWFCEPDSRPDNSDYQHNYPTSGAEVMNRALGATTAIADGILSPLKSLGYDLAIWNDGLFYQWGRKDPLRLNADGSAIYDDANDTSDGTAGDASYSKSIKNPKVFYSNWTGTYTSEDADAYGWSTSKSINDPCPPGYKVPETSIWRTNNNSTGMEDLFSLIPNLGYPYNLEANIDVSHNIVYPYSSYIDPANSMVPEKGILPVEYRTPSGTEYLLGIKVLDWEIASDKVKDIVFEINLDSNMGLIWSNSKSALEFHHAAFDLLDFNSIWDKIRIKSCWISHNDYEIEYFLGFIPTGIKSNWRNYQEFPNGPGDYLTDTDLTILYAQIFTQLISFNERECSIDQNTSPATGLHVRCVMDVETEE